MLTPKQIIDRQANKGKTHCLRAEYVGHGVTWLGFGKTQEAAIKDLFRVITNYFTPYESK